MRYLIRLTVAVAVTASSFEALPGGDIYTFLDGKGVYERVKKDATGRNLEIFEIYEKQASRKIISACIDSGVSYVVAARWDLEIVSRSEAQEVARTLCEGNGAVGSVLLGYKVKGEIRF